MMAYVTFNNVKDLNTHHQIYHGNMIYKCPQCKEAIATPSTWRFHRYCHKPMVHKCPDCYSRFVNISKLRQHHHKHFSQKMYRCFFGGCTKRYKHPQDLERQVTFECKMCDKNFKQKHLLK